MQSSSLLVRAASPALPRWRLPRVTEGRAIFGLTLCLYLLAGSALVFGGNIIEGDALSRVGNAAYVLYSRDPHLAAIGFVWNPLPSLLILPLLPFKALFPQLVERGFAANIVSSVFMAGAVHQLWRIFSDLGLRRGWRLALTVLFALHPMVLFYGANGMSEAPFLFFLMLAVRCLAAWLLTARLEWQVYTGLALGGAYLCRYEALPAGLGALAVVAVVSWTRARANSDRPLATAFCDTAIAAAPFLLAVAVWAVASLAIVGHPFEQFSSIYGNSAQMRTRSLQAADGGIGGLIQVMALEPLLLAVVVLGLVNAARQKEVRVIAVLAVLCPVLAFAAWAHLSGATAPWIRYFIVVIPLTSLMAGVALVSAVEGAIRPRRWLQPGFALAITVSLLAAGVLSGAAMTNSTIAPEEGHKLAFLTAGGHRTADQQRAANEYVTERAIAAYLDGLELPPGSVLVDTFTGFPVVLAARHAERFVITSDRNFKQCLADPQGTGIRYLLVPGPTFTSSLDAINRTYPGIFTSGGGVATLVRAFPNAGDGPDWRLYRVGGAP